MLRIRLVNGHWATVHGVLTEPEMTGTVSVIIGPASREHLTLLTAATYGLTPREQQVAELILRGHATHRIVHRLEISTYTALEHLRHIFAKVGVASRGELVAALFRRMKLVATIDYRFESADHELPADRDLGVVMSV